MSAAFLPRREPESPPSVSSDPFLAAVRCPSGRVDALGAALAIVLDVRPDADVAALRETMDGWGERLSVRMRRSGVAADPLAGVLLLNQLLFDEEGFRGDVDCPHDPANSELDLVFERRLGLPITLALIHVEVGKRAGLPLHGISFPGRFLVGLAMAPRPLLFDPFRQGMLVLPEECQGLLASSAGPKAVLRPEFLQPCSGARFVERMLQNLKHAHVRKGELSKAIGVQGRIVELRQGDASPLQERAWLSFQLGRHGDAVRDLEVASTLTRDEESASEVRRQLEHVRRWSAALR